LKEKQLLMIPGPTPVPQSVLLAGAAPMINHRGPEFAEALAEVTEGLKRVFQTRHDVFVLTGSGTGGLEAAVVNALSPGDTALSVSIGVFGDRFATIAKTFGVKVESLDFEWGAAADPAKIRERLAADQKKKVKAVLITQNETSTGVTNDLATIGPIVREHGALLLVDGISSLVAMDCQMDAWCLDLVVAGSQKAFMIPPGLVFVAMNDRAWSAMEKATIPRFYWDLGKAKDYLARGQTPWTPAVPQVFQLRKALQILEEEGLQACFARHALQAGAVRAGVQALGLTPFADPSHASNAVTSVRKPDGVEIAALRKLLLEKYGVVLAGGQQTLSDKIFRIGHLGYVGESDIIATLGALGMALKELGLSVDPAAGVAAAVEHLGGG
jgi:aspartate aminotransferase-like enzyme